VIYVVEAYRMSNEARYDLSFCNWLREFNSMMMDKNPLIKSVKVYVLYSGAPEIEIWIGMEDFAALDRSAEIENAMTQDPEVMEMLRASVRYMNPIGRKIMQPLALDQEAR
jgi:hypothetical protein